MGSDRRIAEELLGWYDRHRRDFPWRTPAGEAPDPYGVWVSEIMLQQTSPKVVVPYYRRFLRHWPNVEALARAEEGDVLRVWQGLGYYARARAMIRAAVMIVEDFSSRFPDDPARLRRLPGIGDYTAGAIAAIAFNRPAAAIDTNVGRVLARLEGLAAPSRRQLGARALSLTLPGRAGDTVQAMIELGAQVCRSHHPACSRCCWRGDCRARRYGRIDAIPRRPKPTVKKKQHAVIFWIEHRGRVRMRRRAGHGLLASMSEFPSTPWRATPWTRSQALEHAPCPADWQWLEDRVRHQFSHIDLKARIARARITGPSPISPGFWVDPNAFDDQPLPALMRKVIRCCVPRGVDEESRSL